MEDRPEHYPEFSPDGRMVAFTTNDGLRVRTLSGQVSEPLAPFQGIGSLTWMPDGSRILYSSRGGVWSVTPAGGAPQPVLERAGTSFALSPDGKHLLVAERASPTLWRILTSSPPGATPKPIAEFPVPANSEINFGRFAPDGTKYFVAVGNSGPGLERWVMPFPAGKPSIVTQFRGESAGSLRGPSWFPDSRHAVTAVRRDMDQIVVADTGSTATATVLLNQENQVQVMSLSPDGKSLVFARGTISDEIVEFDLANKRATRVAAGRRRSTAGNWTADGAQHVWFTGLSQRGPTLHYRTASAEQRVPMEGPVLASQPRMSPDGRRVAYTTADAVWVFAPGARPIRLADAPTGMPLAAGLAPPCWSSDST
jgi:Tol biopolymer transport system component